MNDKYKIAIFILYLICNFTFLATAQTNQSLREDAKKLPECARLYGSDSMKTRYNMAYFQENWKKKEYRSTYACWTYVFNHAPCAYKSIHQIGPQLLSALIDHPDFADRKAGLMDTLFMIFPARIRYFGEEAFVKGSWAYYLSHYRTEQTKDIIDLYAFYFEQQKKGLDDRYVRDYMHQALRAHEKGLLDKDNLCSLFVQLKNISQSYKTKYMNDSVAYADWSNTLIYLEQQMSFKCVSTYPADCCNAHHRIFSNTLFPFKESLIQPTDAA